LINVKSCALDLINPYAKDYKYIKTDEDESELDEEIIITVIAVIFIIIIVSGIIFCLIIRKN